MIESKNTIGAFLFLSSLSVSIFYLPNIFLLAFIVCLVHYVSMERKYIFAISISFFIYFFSIINASKFPESDWFWYVRHFIHLRDLGFFDYFSIKIDNVTPRSSEPVYHYISSFISKSSEANVNLLVLFISAFIYGLSGFSIYLLMNSKISSQNIFPIIGLSLLVGLTFTLTLHLVRQEIAVGFIALGAVLLFRKFYLLAFLFLLLSILTHNSAVILCSCLVFGYFIFKFSKFKRPILFLLILSYMAAGFLMINYQIGYSNFSKDDGAIGWPTLLLDISIICILIAIIKKSSDNYLFTQYLLISLLLYAAFVLSVSSQPLALLRFYLYMDFFRLFFISVLSSLVLSRLSPNIFLTSSYLFFGFIYLNLRIVESPFVFDVMPANFFFNF